MEKKYQNAEIETKNPKFWISTKAISNKLL
jgi:hypothetical protein